MSKYNTNKNKYLAKSERASVPKITKKQKGSIERKEEKRGEGKGEIKIR